MGRVGCVRVRNTIESWSMQMLGSLLFAAPLRLSITALIAKPWRLVIGGFLTDRCWLPTTTFQPHNTVSCEKRLRPVLPTMLAWASGKIRDIESLTEEVAYLRLDAWSCRFEIGSCIQWCYPSYQPPRTTEEYSGSIARPGMRSSSIFSLSTNERWP